MGAVFAKSMSAKVLKVMCIFGGVQAVGIVCSLVRAKLISVWIGPVGVGLFAIFNSVLDLLSTSTQLNMKQSAVRDLSASAASHLPEVITAVRWWARRLGVVGAVAMLLLSPLLSYISFNDVDMWWAFAALAAAVYLMSNMNGEQAIMQGIGSLKPLARSAAWGALTGTVVSIPMYYYFGKESIVPSILAFSLAGFIATKVLSRAKSIRQSRSQSIAIGKGFLRLGLYITISTAGDAIASYVFVSYLNTSASTDVAGLYQSGYTLIMRYAGIIFTALAVEYYPRLVKVAFRPRMASVVASHEMSLLISVLIPVLVVFIAADEYVVRLLYTSAFLPVLPMVTIGICGTLFRAMSYCMSYVILARADGRIFIVTEMISAVSGLILNIWLYRTLGFVGLGVAYLLWYVIYAATVWVVYRWRYGMTVGRTALSVSLVSVAVAVCAVVLKSVVWWAPLPLLVPIGIAAIMYYKKRRHK